jgi:thiamine kinase-like enzyme
MGSDYSNESDDLKDFQQDVDLKELFIKEKNKNSRLILKFLKEKSQFQNLKLNFENLFKDFQELEEYTQDVVKENKILKEILLNSSKELSQELKTSEKVLKDLGKLYSQFSKVQKSLEISEYS